MRRFATKAFYRLFAIIAKTTLPHGACDFRLLDRRVVDALNACTERSRFTNGLYAWVGFRRMGVPFEVAARANGHSQWGLFTLWRFAVDAITSFSMMPLRIWSYLGVIISLFALSYGGFIVLRTLISGIDVPGYASLITAIMFFSGVQLISLGVIGEYLGRVFIEVKRRPLFVVAEEQGFERRGAFSSMPPAASRSPARSTDGSVQARSRADVDGRGGLAAGLQRIGRVVPPEAVMPARRSLTTPSTAPMRLTWATTCPLRSLSQLLLVVEMMKSARDQSVDDDEVGRAVLAKNILVVQTADLVNPLRRLAPGFQSKLLIERRQRFGNEVRPVVHLEPAEGAARPADQSVVIDVLVRMEIRHRRPSPAKLRPAAARRRRAHPPATLLSQAPQPVEPEGGRDA